MRQQGSLSWVVALGILGLCGPVTTSCGRVVVADETTGDTGDSGGASGTGATTTTSDSCTDCVSDPIAEITTGMRHACVLLPDGRVKCWGNNAAGQLGYGAAPEATFGDAPGELGSALPTVLLGSSVAVQHIVAGAFHTCVLTTDGAVKCWGWGDTLGLGSTDHKGDIASEMGDALPFVDLGAGKVAIDVVAGSTHSCALLEDGSLKCWGHNDRGELGYGSISYVGDEPGEMGDALPAVDLGAGKKVVAVSLGGEDFWEGGHTCALLDDGQIKCWGRNDRGQLGLGSTEDVGDEPGEMGDALPTVDLGAGKKAVAVTAGGAHTCALLEDQTVKCWGRNAGGALGVGSTEDLGEKSPDMGDALPTVNLGSWANVVGLAAGTSHTCALRDDGTTKCWGRNNYGALGIGSTEGKGINSTDMGDALPAVDLGVGETAVMLAPSDDFTCVKLANERAKCWGRNPEGQLGVGHAYSLGDEPGEMGDALPELNVE
jgi:alpha-tubulin suppressor-like RCC1 family protein